jgi:signal transduction histidine kinase
MQSELQFKISAALKNIIGKDLISDDYIAIFELVKNSYDAHATRVEVKFEGIYTSNPKIIITDNGKGMSLEDLKEKWLFVAYSAKKDGTEDSDYDYRKNIKTKRAYAGAKGIGRFSCDRLGGNLYLETRKNETNAITEALFTDWDKFDQDITDEFVNISVLHESLKANSTNYGTRLEITNLRSSWDRGKLLLLKGSLAKLINPNTFNPDNNFSINLTVEEEKYEDSNSTHYNEIVNGEIQNLIFETLDIKTTKITSKISIENEQKIETCLYEGGKLVYRIIEENTYEGLSNVEHVIYYMNFSAKQNFSKRMGVQPVEYGHIYMYKNGIRIYPYGERGEDPLQMDNRKTQGTKRFLGTREVIGYIAINAPNEDLKETSSRGDGLLKTKTYYELKDWFYSSIKKLEKFGIEIVNWGTDLSNDDYIKLDDDEKVLALTKLIKNLSKSKKIISFEASDEIYKILDKKQENAVAGTLSEVKDEILSDNIDKETLLEKIKAVENSMRNLKEIKDEAEKEVDAVYAENTELTNKLEIQIKKGSFQGALIGTDRERIISLQHQVFHSSGRINTNIKHLIQHLNPKKIDLRTAKLLKIISLESSKINSIAKFVTKANFNLNASEITVDLVEFICDYINEIYLVEESIIKIDTKILIKRPDSSYLKKIRPLELTIIIDNLISNAEKANSKTITFDLSVSENSFELLVTDDGNGIASSFIADIFDLGFTTTNGSGIGLYQCRDLITNSLGGTIDVKSEPKKGTTFRIKIK